MRYTGGHRTSPLVVLFQKIRRARHTSVLSLNKPRINSAAPSDKILQNCREKITVPCFFKPGIIHSLLDSIPDETKQKEQFILSFNGKLIRSRLSGEHGDVDMAGRKPNIEESKEA